MNASSTTLEHSHAVDAINAFVDLVRALERDQPSKADDARRRLDALGFAVNDTGGTRDGARRG